MYVGSDIELAHHIADSLGVECHIVPLEFSAVLAGVTSGKYDLAISALAYTPARAEAMALSDGYYFDTGENSGYGLMVRTEDLAAITSADDLADKTVVVQSGSMQELLLNTQVPAVGETKLVSATTDGFLMVQEDKADAIITRHRHRPALHRGQPRLRPEHCAGLQVHRGPGVRRHPRWACR